MKKGIGDKVLGWFIVDEEEAPSPEPLSSEPSAPPVVVPGACHDAEAFAAVYRAAGVADQERERLSKVLGLIEALPGDASAEVKRAIVGASLEAFGVPIDRILVTGEGALGALDAYVAAGQQRTHEVLEQADARVAKLTAEIADVKRLMEVQVDAQQELVRSTATEKARIRVALDFFGGPAAAKKGLRLVG